VIEISVSAPPASPPPPRLRRRWWLLAACAVPVLLAAAVAVRERPAAGPDLAPSTGPVMSARPAPPRPAIPGRIFYEDQDGGGGGIVRIGPGATSTTMLTEKYDVAAVSPDGERVVYIRGGRLLEHGKPIWPGRVNPRERPAWSPDGWRLFVGAPGPGVLDLATGRFDPLPATLDGHDFRWSDDGQRLVYGTGNCRLKVAAAGGRTGTTVPVLGDPDEGRNPQGLAACRALSVDPSGRRATVGLHWTPGSDPAYAPSDNLIDLVTGKVLTPPTGDEVRQILFGPDGSMLVRDFDEGGTAFALSAYSPHGQLIATVPEPARLWTMDIVAWTG
jgi:hypothetical protein